MTVERDEISTGLIALVGIAGALLLFVIVTALQAWYYTLTDAAYYQKVITQPPAELTNLWSQQQAQLQSYKWVDRDRQVVQIPIERAMQVVAGGTGLYPPPTPTPAPAAVGSATQAESPQAPAGEQVSAATSEVSPATASVSAATPEINAGTQPAENVQNATAAPAEQAPSADHPFGISPFE